MFVCVCKAVSDTEVKAVISEGARTVAEVTARCGAGGDCGSCKGTIQCMIERAGAGDDADASDVRRLPMVRERAA